MCAMMQEVDALEVDRKTDRLWRDCAEARGTCLDGETEH
jgi:hypothetical protein